MSRLLVYVHYNKYNDYSEYVDYQLREITPLFDRTVFVSNSQLSTSIIEHLQTKFNISNPIIRENIGFDFAAWRDGLFCLDCQEILEFDSITFMNDTCFGPIWDVESYYQYFEQQKDVDFWGMTNPVSYTHLRAHETRRHLVCRLLLEKKKIKYTTIIQNSLRYEKCCKFSDVQNVIDQYETQLTNLLLNDGFRYSSILDTTKIENKGKLNFSLDHPKELLEKRIPLLKVKLFELHQPIASSILEEIKKQSNYPTDLIIDHLTQIYYPDSVFKLSQKLLKKETALFNSVEHFNGAVIIHLTDLWAFNIIVDKLKELKNIFKLIISVETEKKWIKVFILNWKN
ncbi:hypothetical protein SUT007_09900 [Streptococcus parasuis]|nr:hypothetical protein SUT007_09900 [Streptococcus parasuis]